MTANGVVLVGLLARHLRPPASTSIDAQGNVSATFSPPLSATEQATYDELVTMAQFGVTLTLSEWQAIKPDVVNLRAFYNNASPTNPQSVAAMKSVIAVLRALFRDG